MLCQCESLRGWTLGAVYSFHRGRFVFSWIWWSTSPLAEWSRLPAGRWVGRGHGGACHRKPLKWHCRSWSNLAYERKSCARQSPPIPESASMSLCLCSWKSAGLLNLAISLGQVPEALGLCIWRDCHSLKFLGPLNYNKGWDMHLRTELGTAG